MKTFWQTLILLVVMSIPAGVQAYEISRYNTVRMDNNCLACHPGMRSGYMLERHSLDNYSRLHMKYCGFKQLTHLSRFTDEFAFISMHEKLEELEAQSVDTSIWRDELQQAQSRFEVLLRQPVRSRMGFREPAKAIRDDLTPSYNAAMNYEDRFSRRAFYGVFSLYLLAFLGVAIAALLKSRKGREDQQGGRS